jgi:hypothetical protein
LKPTSVATLTTIQSSHAGSPETRSGPIAATARKREMIAIDPGSL